MSDDLYAIENSTPSLSGILRIGFTTRTSEERLKEHNSNRNKEILAKDCFEWPDNWKIVYKKKVSNGRLTERILHVILHNYNEIYGSQRELFRISVKELKEYVLLALKVKYLIEIDIAKKTEFNLRFHGKTYYEETHKELFSKENIYSYYWIAKMKQNEDDKKKVKEVVSVNAPVTGFRCFVKNDKEWKEERTTTSLMALEKDADDEPAELFVGKRSYIYNKL